MAEYLKIPEVADLFGLSEQTIRRRVKSGEIPSVFVGGVYRIPKAGLDEYLERARVRAVTPHPKAPPASALPDDLQAARERIIELRTKWVGRRTSETGALSEADLEALEDELKQNDAFLKVVLNREMSWLRGSYPDEWDVTDRAVVGPEVAAYVQLFLDALSATGTTAEPETAAMLEPYRRAG